MKPDVFGYVAMPFGRVDPRWTAVKDHRVDLHLDPPDLVQRVDRSVNKRIRYQGDTGDSWAAPQDTLTRGAGDCEDYALLKRAILIASGFPEEHIVLLIVRDVIARRDHAVLLVHDSEWLVLDCYNALTLPAKKVRDYTPLLAFSGNSAWGFARG